MSHGQGELHTDGSGRHAQLVLFVSLAIDSFEHSINQLRNIEEMSSQGQVPTQFRVTGRTKFGVIYQPADVLEAVLLIPPLTCAG